MPAKEGDGTLITIDEDEPVEQALISGIAFNRDEAQITVLGVPDKPGIAYQILGPVADANIEVDMIVQNISGDNVKSLGGGCRYAITCRYCQQNVFSACR